MPLMRRLRFADAAVIFSPLMMLRRFHLFSLR